MSLTWNVSTGVLSNGEREQQFRSLQAVLLDRLADGRLHGREVLCSDIWGDDPMCWPKTRVALNVLLYYVRKKLKPFEIEMRTFPEHGWRLSAPLARTDEIE